eukprot:Skav222801  [mRNA]  locus=scaffold1419:399983:408357:+ [translate_table: standard]
MTQRGEVHETLPGAFQRRRKELFKLRYTDISKTAPLASAAEDRGLHWLAMLVAVGALGNTLTTATRRNGGGLGWVWAVGQGGLGAPEELSSFPEGSQPRPMALARLEKRGSDLGLGPREVKEALSLNRPIADLAWVTGSDLGGLAIAAAEEKFEQGRWLEYECHDSRWQPQGRGAIRLDQWEDKSKGLFTGHHGPSSDGYYDYYVQNQMGPDNGLYHICDGDASRCRARKARGDHRELIHIDKWRLLSPMSMLSIGYLAQLGEREGQDALAAKARENKEPLLPTPGTGLDAAVAAATAAAPQAPRVGEGVIGRSRKEKRSRSPQRKRDFPQFLVDKAAKSASDRERRQKEKDRKHQKKKKRKKVDVDDDLSPERDESVSGQSGGGERVESGLAGAASPCLSEPDFVRESPSESDGPENGPRTADVGHEPRPSIGRAVGSDRRPANPTLQSLRTLIAGQRMDDGKALGDNSSSSVRSGGRGRKRIRLEARAAGSENPRSHDQGSAEQIGTRQRTVSESREVREPGERKKPKSSRASEAAKHTTEQRRRQEERSHRDVRRGPDPPPKRRKPTEEAGSSPQSSRRKGRDPKGGKPSQGRGPKGQRMEVLEVPERKGRQKGPGKGKRKGSERVTSQPASAGAQSGAAEVSSRKVAELMSWLRENQPKHLTAAQVGTHLVLQAVTLNGTLGQLLEMSLAPTWVEGERKRNLFPLPLWPDVRDALEEIIEKMKFKDDPGDWRERGDTKSKANRALRKQGLLVWHGLVVVALNWLHADGRPHKGVGPPGGQANASQEAALGRIWEMVKVFVDDKPEQGGVPRTPDGPWKEELAKLRVSYTGEVVEKAMPLTLSQILPGLPSPDHGGLVNILEVVDEKLARKLERPDLLVKPLVPDYVPEPNVMCGDIEWGKVAKALYERHLVAPVERYPRVGDAPVLNGAFGVVKPDKFTEDNQPVLRMIIDLRASNAILEQLEGDVHTLTGSSAFQKLVVDYEDDLLISGDDLTAAFYLFKLPPAWSEYLVLRKPIPWDVLEPGKPGETYLGLSVLPMGWNSAVAVMQSAHRQLALRSEAMLGAGLMEKSEVRKDAEFPDIEEGPIWQVYLDDTTILERIEKSVSEYLVGKPPEEQQRLRRAYSWWGIPTNAAKALERVRKAERLGACIDGEKGLLRGSTKRGLELMSLGAHLREEGAFSKKGLQIYAGKAAEIDPVVTASDACETGGAAVFASRLSRLGEEELLRSMEEPTNYKQQPSLDFRDGGEGVVVIDLFAGIGGLERSLELAGVKPVFAVAVESDRDCRRCLRRATPGLELWGDITTVTKEKVMEWIKKVPNATGVVTGCGSPCQGLSSLSVDREHLKDPRSKLFYDGARVIKLIKEVAEKEGMWSVSFCENVIPDDIDIKEMSRVLEVHPVMVDAGLLSRVRRPRLFWLDVDLAAIDEVEVYPTELFEVVEYGSVFEDDDVFLEEGHTWEGGSDPHLRFPTFTRAIPRKQPPKSPAGIKNTPPDAEERWRSHGFRYPPYTYRAEYMIKHQDGELKPLTAIERERLMGFLPNHTLGLAKKLPETEAEKQSLEDARCAAVGNSFHTVAVASLLDHALWSLGVKDLKGHHLIREQCSEQLKAANAALSSTVSLPELTSEAEEASQVADPNLEGYSSDVTEAQVEKFEQIPTKAPKLKPGPVQGLSDDERRRSIQMVAAFVKRQEYRGSDVRLDIGTMYRPEAFPRATVNPHKWEWHIAHSYEFQPGQHINVLELCAVNHTFEWRLRRSTFGDCRALHLSDSQVVLGVIVKGRSSSRQLNRLLRRLAALLVAGGVQLVVLNGATKAARQQERSKVGKLSSLVVQDKTRLRYAEAYQSFLLFHRLSPSFALPEFDEFDNLVAEYVEFLWEDGRPKSEASYALAALQFHRPQCKHHLPWSWKLVKTWNQVELPTRATPLTPELLLSLAGQCFIWKQERMGWLLVLGFAAMLRTSELLNLKVKDVHLPKPHQPKEAVVLLTNTKSAKRNFLPLEKVVIDEQTGLQALHWLIKGLSPGDTLSQVSNYAFRKLWKDLLVELRLDQCGYMPYSLRRGAATSAYKQGVPLDVLVTKGRWQHIPTARIYLDQGLQSLGELSLPLHAQPRLSRARQRFISVSQQGARGRQA